MMIDGRIISESGGRGTHPMHAAHTDIILCSSTE
jgi:hypothetical protein